MKVLLIRMDRLGDLVCTLPVDQHPYLAKAEVEWLTSKGLEPVLELAEPKRRYRAIRGNFSWVNLINLTKEFRQKKFDKVILFYAPWWVGFACFLAGIAERFSPRSRWYQLLFFNKTLRQNRSRSEQHEADYNWDLIQWALCGTSHSDLPTPVLHLKATTPAARPLPEKYIVIHPGMGGSALNWPSSHYLKLAQLLVAQGKHIVITGTAGDLPWLREIEQPLRELPHVHWFVGQLDLPRLIYVLGNSEATIAPSTGVLHLAASTGVKSIGVYSPIRVQTPVRWGPRGPKALAIVPPVQCPASKRCLESRCKLFPCMGAITPEQLLGEIQRP